MQGLQVFIRTVDAMNEWLGRLIAWLTLGCVLVTFGVAVMRYQFSIGRPWAEELYVWLHAFVFMAGAGYTFIHHGHVRVDIFYGSVSPRRRAWIDLVGTLAFLMPWLLVIAYYCWPFVVASWRVLESSNNPGGMPALFILKSLIYVFVVVVGIQGLALMARRILYLAGDERYAPETGEH